MKGLIFVIIACALWAADTLIRYPLLFQGHGAESIVFSEHLLLTLFFLPVLLKSKTKFLQLRLSTVFYFLIIGGFGSAIGTLAFTKAFSLINPSLVILLQKFQPIVAIVLSYFILKERMGPAFFAWACVALVGGVMISFQDLAPAFNLIAQGDLNLSTIALKGYGLTLVAVFGWGAATVYGKKLGLSGFDEKEIMAGRFLMGLLCLIPLLLSFNMNFSFEKVFWLKILTLCVMSGIVAMYFYYKGLKLIPAHLCTLTEMFFPFFAVLVNWVFLGKDLSMMQISGAALLLLSSSMIQLKHY